MNFAQEDDVGFTAKWLMFTFILVGLLLIFISFVIPHEDVWNYLSDICRELGVVVSSVFSVSLLYERLIAKKHVRQFLGLLREQIEQGESNAAICARLGITKIYYARDEFQREFPITELLKPADGLRLRIVAQTLYFLMNRAGAIKESIEDGATIELCMFDPDSPREEFRKHPDLLVSDIQSAVSVFKREIASWARTAQPPGEVELRFHQIPFFDSMLLVESRGQALLVWDLGFGRDIADKRTLLIDPSKVFGEGLKRRYEHVWNQATTVFKYDGQILVDKLPTSDSNSGEQRLAASRTP